MVQGLSRWSTALAAAGVFAAAALAVCLNVLAARRFQRWDVTTAGTYTLSPATVETLEALDTDLEVHVFLGRGDPLWVTVRHVLDLYRQRAPGLRVHWVDPDSKPAEFQALQQRFQVVAGRTPEGRVVTDAALVIVRPGGDGDVGERHWFISSDDLVRIDPDSGRSRPQLEQAFTEGIRNVLDPRTVHVCFSTGHQELSLDDVGPKGLAEFRHVLEKDNYATRVVDLETPLDPSLRDCRVVVVAAPELPFSAKAAKRLVRYLRRGGNVGLFVNPLLGADDGLERSGLESVARLAGVELTGELVVEGDPAARLPGSRGETFVVAPEAHATTRRLVRGGGQKVDHRLLFSAPQALETTDDSIATALARTSPRGIKIADVRSFLDGARAGAIGSGSDVEQGVHALAFATELPKVEGAAPHGPRVVVVGAGNPLWGQSFRDPALAGNRLFAESAVAWLAAAPLVVSVPEKPSRPIGMSLTEGALGELQRYVLLYMPGTAFLVGALILWGRRRGERLSRREADS